MELIGEQYSGKDPDMRTHFHIRQYERICGYLANNLDIESGLESFLLYQRQVHLKSLGITSDDHLYNRLYRHHAILRDRLRNPIVRSDFPSKVNFEARMKTITGELSISKRLINFFKPNQDQHLPLVTPSIQAIDVALFAHCDWKSVHGRGSTLEDYCYHIALGMCSEYLYTTMTESGDEIKINQDWRVVNGRHRSLILRVLGPDYVNIVGMNDWVKVKFANY